MGNLWVVLLLHSLGDMTKSYSVDQHTCYESYIRRVSRKCAKNFCCNKLRTQPWTHLHVRCTLHVYLLVHSDNVLFIKPKYVDVGAIFICRDWRIYLLVFKVQHSPKLGTAAAQWLRCCATNRKVAGSIPAGVTGIFHWHKILPIELWPWGSTQPLTEMSTRSISWG